MLEHQNDSGTDMRRSNSMKAIWIVDQVFGMLDVMLELGSELSR